MRRGAYLAGKGSSARHTKASADRVQRIVAGCGFQRIADIDAGAAHACLAARLAAGMGLATGNHYLTAAKMFAKWLVKDRRTTLNALEHLTGWNAKTDVRHQRRAIADAEARRLLDASAIQKTRLGLSGADRSMLYAVALGTGLRASELASLTPASFDMAAATPTVTIQAANAKNRKAEILPIHPGLAAMLAPWIATKAPGSPLWPGNWAAHCWAGKILQRDLAAAGIPHETADGFLDFHALRHSFISAMARAGVPLTTAQKLARHSDPKLTANRYTHLGLSDLAGSVPALPGPAATPVPAIALALALATPVCPPIQPLAPDLLGIKLASGVQRFGKSKDSESSVSTVQVSNAPGVSRTRNLRSRNPLLYPIELRGRKVG